MQSAKTLDGQIDALKTAFEALEAAIAPEAIHLQGHWSSSRSLVYADPSQEGTGRGPYREVESWRWEGVLTSAEPVTGVVFMGRGGEWHWTKAPPAVHNPSVVVQLNSWADEPSFVTFTGAFHGVYPVGLAARLVRPPPEGCAIDSSSVPLGRIHCIATADNACLALLVLPGHMVRNGRNRLWHLRESLAAQLGEPARTLLSRRRTGTLRL